MPNIWWPGKACSRNDPVQVTPNTRSGLYISYAVCRLVINTRVSMINCISYIYSGCTFQLFNKKSESYFAIMISESYFATMISAWHCDKLLYYNCTMDQKCFSSLLQLDFMKKEENFWQSAKFENGLDVISSQSTRNSPDSPDRSGEFWKCPAKEFDLAGQNVQWKIWYSPDISQCNVWREFQMSGEVL